MLSRLSAILLLCVVHAHFLFGGEKNLSRDHPQVVIGLSPFLDNSLKDTVYRRIIGLLLEDIPLDSSVSIYDAYNVHTIAQVQVPNVSAFRSAKTRANQFKDPIRKLKDFLAATHPPPEVAKPSSKLNFQNAI